MKTWKYYVLVLVFVLFVAAPLFAQCPGGQCPTQPSWNPPTPSWKPAAPSNVRQPKYPAIVHVIFQYNGQPQSRGSGFIADRDSDSKTAIVITCAHGYKALMSIQIVLHDGRSFDANILCVDSVHDLCIVQISDPGIEPLEIANTAPTIRERMTMIGFAGSDTTLTISSGNMTRWYSPSEGGTSSYISTSCNSKSGCSGGPILNSRGQVSATVTGSFDGCVGPCLAKTLHLLQCKSL